MTKIILFKEEKNIVAFSCQGHSGFGKRGTDVVCSAISSLTQSACLGILKVVGVKGCKFDVNPKKATLDFALPKNLDDQKMQHAQTILKTMELSLKDLLVGFEKFFELEERNEIY